MYLSSLIGLSLPLSYHYNEVFNYPLKEPKKKKKGKTKT